MEDRKLFDQIAKKNQEMWCVKTGTYLSLAV